MIEPSYPPDEMIREAASLFHLLGGIAPNHLVVVGGLVPPLLVPDAASSHVGSADIDLSLSVAIVKGKTNDYYRSLERIIEPYFELFESGFRWRKREGVGGVRLLVDFLGPEIESSRLEDGTIKLEDAAASQNAGVRLRPFPLAAAALVDADAMESTIEGVDLVYKPGVRADVQVRHAGPVGFFASKADALATRDDSKDGYDIAWVCLNAKPNELEVAQMVIERPAFKDPYFQESVAILKSAFKAPDYPGPDGYAREEHPELDRDDESYRRARNDAYLAVSKVVEAFEGKLWTS